MVTSDDGIRTDWHLGKGKKRTGRYVPKYCEHIPFDVREENDYIEYRILWDDWEDYRDGQRNFCWGYGDKPLLDKNKILRMRSCGVALHERYFQNAKKWHKKMYWKRRRKMKRKMFYGEL